MMAEDERDPDVRGTPRPFMVAALEDLGLTQVKFAEELGFTPETVNRWLRDKQLPPAWVGQYLMMRMRLQRIERMADFHAVL